MAEEPFFTLIEEHSSFLAISVNLVKLKYEPNQPWEL